MKWLILKFLLGALLVSTSLTARTQENIQVPIVPEETVSTVVPPVLPGFPVVSDVTMYSGVESCNDKNCTMASGKSAYTGAVACPRKYELGTKVKIGDSIYTCEDRTAVRYDGRFDIFAGYDTKAHEKAIQWGIRKIEVFILE